MNLRAKIFSPAFAIRRQESCASPVRFVSALGNQKSKIKNQEFGSAFTLIELLVVIAIIGILAAIGLPAMRGMTRSNAMVAANRQFLDDLGFARQRAIADHTTVYVVFVSTNITQLTLSPTDPKLLRQITNLYTGQYTTYALLELRQLGEQPGRATPKYLTGWRSLPSGVFFPPRKFVQFPPPGGTGFDLGDLPPSPYALPFPVATNYPPGLQIPFIAFTYLGQLYSPNPFVSARDQYIPFARGSIFINPFNHAADVQENPVNNSVINSNVVYINALTGRAKVLQPQIQ